MNTNDNFNSKKIMEDIDGLENDTKSKKVSRKFKFLNFVETLIFIVLMGIVVFVVLYSCIDAMLEGIDTDYGYTDSQYSSYDDYSYDNYTNENTNLNTNRTANTNLNSNMTLEEFLKTDIGNKILSNSVHTNTIKNEVGTENKINENTNTNIDTSANTNTNTNAISNTQSIQNESVDDSEEIQKKEAEKQKEKLIINEVGKSINGELIINIENTNEKFVHDFWCFAVFYKGNEISWIEEQKIDLIEKGNKKYLKFEETPKEYDRYELFITKFDQWNYKYTLLNDMVSCTAIMEDELLKIKIKNNASEKLNRVDLTIIYYDENREILDIANVSDYNIRKDGSVTGYGVFDETKKEYINFKDYEIIVDEAVCYN